MHWYEYLFSIRNDKKKNLKILYILGITIKLKHIVKKTKKSLLEKCKKEFYGQDGEDALLSSFFWEQNKKYNGFYVDIGAYHPCQYSNTYLFYKNGWRGINIDGTPGSMKEFKKYRPDDINIEAVISDKENEVKYFIFEEAALNNFDIKRTDYLENIGFPVIDVVKLKTQKINDILDIYVKQEQKIDFINIDIEGVDYDVICSLDYEKFSPKYFIIEELDYVKKDFVNYEESKIYKFLSQKGYRVAGKTKRSVIYEKN